MSNQVSKCCKVNESRFGTCANCGLPFEGIDRPIVSEGEKKKCTCNREFTPSYRASDDPHDIAFAWSCDIHGIQENAKCEKFFTKEDDGLSKEWGGIQCFATLHMVAKQHEDKNFYDVNCHWNCPV